MLKLFLKYSVGSWLAAGLSIFTLPIVTALIRPAEFGKAAMFVLVLGLSSQLSQLGCDQAFVRFYYADVHKEQRGKLLYSCLVGPMAVATLVSMLIILAGSNFTPWAFGSLNPSIATVLAVALPLSVIERFSSLTVRLEQRALAYSMLRLILAVAGFAATVAYAVLVRPDFMALAVAQTLALALVTVAGVYFTRSTWMDIRIDWSVAKQMLRYGLPFIPAFSAMWLFEGADRLMLRALSTFEELGIFSAGYRFVTIIALITASFATFWVPVTFELFERDPDEARRLGSTALDRMGGLLVLAGCCVLLARELVILLFAPEYRSSMGVMPFLLFVPILFTLSEVTVGGINFAKKPGWHGWIALAAAAANVALNAALIPLWGARGAAIATATAYAIFLVARTLIAQRYLALDLGGRRLVAALLCFAIACTGATFAPEAPWTNVIVLVVMIAVALLYRNSLKTMAATGLRGIKNSMKIRIPF